MPEKTILEEVQEEFNNPKPKPEKKPEPKKGMRLITKLKIFLGLTVALIAVGTYGVAYFNAWSRYNQFVFQSPVIVQTPVYIESIAPEIISPIGNVAEAKEPEPTEPKSKEQIINEYENAEYIAKVHVLETSKGEAPEGYHKDCERLGLTNEFGYGVYQDMCFATFRESVEAVNEFFTQHLQNMSPEEAICYYNTGYQIRDCEYLRAFRSL